MHILEISRYSENIPEQVCSVFHLTVKTEIAGSLKKELAVLLSKYNSSSKDRNLTFEKTQKS